MTEPRADRLNSIVDCLDRAGADGATRRQLADCLGLKVSPYLTALVNRLVEDGYARAEVDQTVYPPRWKYFTQGVFTQGAEEA